MARIILQLGVAVLILIAVTVSLGLLIAALVAWLEPLVGLAGALGLAGGGFLMIALALALVLRAQARAAERRRQSREAVFGLVELALILLPRRHLARLEAGLAAGVGLAALVAVLLRPEADGADRTSAGEAPAGDGTET